jgi:hypothetical protein
MTIDDFCFSLQNRLIQTSQTGGQWYSDASLFSIPWIHLQKLSDQFNKTFFLVRVNLNLGSKFTHFFGNLELFSAMKQILLILIENYLAYQKV